MKIAVGISGASGMIYTERLLKALLEGGHDVELIISEKSPALLHYEIGLKEGVRFDDFIKEKYQISFKKSQFKQYKISDLAAAPSSGTHHHDGMVVIPCSMKTLSSIAVGSSANLIERSADVSLKERRKLILVIREAPFSRIHIQNMLHVTDAGGIILPANPGFYTRPQSLDDIADFIVGKCLNLLGIEHQLYKPWGESA